MSFLDTQPAPIDRFEFAGPWSGFRVRDPRKQIATLKEISRTDTPVTMGAPGGPTMTASLWSVDDFNGRLHFQVASDVTRAREIVQMPDLWAAAYVDDVKVQFSLPSVMLSQDAHRQVLVAEAPQLMFHLPRRRAMRVRRTRQQAPTARFHWQQPAGPALALSLKVLDISTTGCALWLPPGTPILPPATLLRQVEIELDDQTILFADLTVQNVIPAQPPETGVRIGCEWAAMPQAARERLQQWIQRGRRRRELMSLSFD